MTLDQKEYLENVVAAFNDDPKHASEWEQSFMGDMSERLDKYGADTYVSAKQWAVITRVAEKYAVE